MKPASPTQAPQMPSNVGAVDRGAAMSGPALLCAGADLEAACARHLRGMARPEVYGTNLPRADARALEAAGFIEWLPATDWSGTIYGITDTGCAWVANQGLRDALLRMKSDLDQAIAGDGMPRTREEQRADIRDALKAAGVQS